MIGNYIFPGSGLGKERGAGRSFIQRGISEKEKKDPTDKKYCSIAGALADFEGGVCTGDIYVNGGSIEGRSVLPDVCEFADTCEIRGLAQITGIRVAKKI